MLKIGYNGSTIERKVKFLNKSNFKLIEGGLAGSQAEKSAFFISAYVTDTRLMGVICMYAHWIIDDEDLHQFFYFDCEENGFERYESVRDNDMAQIVITEQSFIGGLGGRKIDITERQARALLQQYMQFNDRCNIKYPAGIDEYKLMTDKNIVLTDREKHELLKKQCTTVKSDYQAINYFLMRCFAHDYEVAKFLTNDGVDVRAYDDCKAASLYRNVIDEIMPGRYMCESLIDSGNRYSLAVSEIHVEDLKVTYFEKCSGFHISTAEAAMMLARPEFVTVYDILTSPEVFDMGMMELSINSMVTSHENGRLYMIFNNNNEHVNKRIFKMSEDVYGIYYVTSFGQLIAAAYSLENICSLEKDLSRSDLAKYLAIVSKYEFKDPILYDFIRSDFENFEEFLEYVHEWFDGDD